MRLQGRVDEVSRQRIQGWVRDPAAPDAPVSLIVTVDDQTVARVLANHYRPDLERAAIGNGRFGFDVYPQPVPSPLARCVIGVRREDDGAHLDGSPIVLEPSTAFDETARTSFERVLQAPDDEAGIEDRLRFLAEQGEILLQMRADRAAARPGREAQRRAWLQAPGWMESAAPSPAPAGADRPKRALVIDECMPATGRDAGSNAIISHMQSLQRIGYAVSFAPFDLAGDPAPLQAAGITCHVRPWCGSVEEVLRRQGGGFDVVYLHRALNASRYIALVRQYQPEARLLYSVADLHFLRLARQAEVEQQPDLKAASQRMQVIELTAALQADVVVTHSPVEAGILAQRLPAEKIHVVPWAVKLQPFTVPFGQRHGVAFIGGYGHAPNSDAARWLVEAVMPELRKLDPAIRCLLVGRDLPASLRRLAVDGVEAVGSVAELAEVFNRVRLTVAPLTYGAGIKGKVLDSMAAGIPCVCTPVAAEGLDLPPLLLDQVASDPAGLATKIQRLHDDEALNEECARMSLAYMAAFGSERWVDGRMQAALGAQAGR